MRLNRHQAHPTAGLQLVTNCNRKGQKASLGLVCRERGQHGYKGALQNPPLPHAPCTPHPRWISG